MVGLVDIAPITTKVEVRGKQITVVGISAKGVAHLLARFPALRSLVTGREVAIEDLLKLGGDVVSAIIAAGVGSPDDPAEEAGANNLTIDEQADLLVAIIKLTIPKGVGPLVEKLSSLGLSSPGSADAGEAQDRKSRKQ